MDVTCTGPFQFDFQKGIATLQDHVNVVRVNPEGESDQLQCDRLLIYFKAAQSPDAPATPDGAPIASVDPAVAAGKSEDASADSRHRAARARFPR